MSFRSNYNEVSAALTELEQTFNLRRRPKGQRRIGDEIADIAATTIRLRTRYGQAGPDGEPLPSLRPSTIRKKAKAGRPLNIGVETGEMLSQGELLGRVFVGSDVVVMTAGTSPETEAKFEYFQEGRPGKQVPRPFYELGEDGEKAIKEYVEEVAEDARKKFEGNQ